LRRRRERRKNEGLRRRWRLHHEDEPIPWLYLRFPVGGRQQIRLHDRDNEDDEVKNRGDQKALSPTVSECDAFVNRNFGVALVAQQVRQG
jgi:hypothetical protein